ncbi:hypothetical protein TcWFU_002530 [Taenia crassiceps]|uniref:Uncharacterized protein n=1 Tax=Taenia crassiceps TaxID=6207 RepID=A0ABR4QKP5_9CEST
MHQEPLLHLPVGPNERLFKFTILTPHTFLPPHHSESLEDELAEEFAEFLCDRVSTILGERSYTPHHDGEAFLNIRFDDFEERFLRHSDYTIFITSGRNAACLDLIYPRMLVFLTIRPTWRNRGIVLYVGKPVGQKLFDQDLFANKPLIFPLNKDEWGIPESPWNELMGTLQTKVPLTPEPKRSKPPKQKPPIKMANADTNENGKGIASMPLDQSGSGTKVPIMSEVCGTQLPSCASESIWSSKKGFSTPPFAHSSSLFFFRSPFRQQEHNSKNNLISSLNDMCLLGNLIRCQNKKLRTKKEQQRRYSDSAVEKKEGYENIDYLCFPSRYKMKKKKRLMTEPPPTQQTEQMIVETPEATRVSVPQISSLLQPRKALQTYCLQVKIDDDSLDKRSSSHSALSSSSSKRKTNIPSNGRRSKVRCDSGIASNFSVISTDVSSSSPSLCYPQHSDYLVASPSTFFSSSSPSCLNHHETDQNRSQKQKRSLDPSSLHSALSQSSITAQYIATLEDSLKFVDDEDPDDEIIRSEQRRINEMESFVKPGIPPLKNHNELEVEIKQSQIFRPKIMNPDSKASSDSIEDPTLTEDYDTEFPEDLSLQSYVGFAQSCEEHKNQGNERFQDLRGIKNSHFDIKDPQENYPLTLIENRDSRKVQKLENELFFDMHFDEQISQKQFPEKVAKSMDTRARVHTFESKGFQPIKNNSLEEYSHNQDLFVNPFYPNNPESKAAQENTEAVSDKALTSSAKLDGFKDPPISSGLKSLENENKRIDKQTFLVNEYSQQPEAIDDQLQGQCETMTEPTQPSMFLPDGVTSTVKTADNDEILRMDEESFLPRNNQASKPDERYSKVQASFDSGLGDSSKAVEVSVLPQSDLILATRTKSEKSVSLSEESVLLSINKPFDSATNLLSFDEIGGQKYQEGTLQDLQDQTPQNEPITVVKADYLECSPPVDLSENRAVLCQQSLFISDAEGHVVPEHPRTDIDQTDTQRDTSNRQNPVSCELLAPKGLPLTEKSGAPKIRSPESGNKRTDASGQRRIFGGEVYPKPKRRSILFDQDRLDNVFNQEACKVLRDMLKDPTPETLQLIRYAVKTYDQYPSLSESIAPTFALAPESESPTARIKQSTSFRRMFPHISIAILNLSTAYIPRYLATIYDYSMASLSAVTCAFLKERPSITLAWNNNFGNRPLKEHPDSRLKEFILTIQEVFLNHPLGVPFLLAGTTLLSPWLVRQFPLTLLATCAAAPDTLRRLLAQPSTFFAEHFADLSEVFHAAPTWTIFAAIGGRGVHERPT